MSITYTDPTVVLARYAPYEPILDDYQADVIEGLHFLWRRHAHTVLAWVPEVPWETTSATLTQIADNDATALVERLTFTPCTPSDWRPDDATDTVYTVVARADKVEVVVECYNAAGLVDSATIAIGAGPATGTGTITLPAATGDVWWRLQAKLNGAGTGTLYPVYIQSSYAAGAPK